MATVVYSAMARADLSEIWAWIAERDGETRADLVVDRMDLRIRQLSDHPKLGPTRPDIAPNARSISCDRWLALYDIQAETVRIIRIVDAARDLATVWPSRPGS